MPDMIPTASSVTTPTEPDPTGKIADKLTKLTSLNKQMTWMAQPLEHAVYVHATDPKQFADLCKQIIDMIDELNASLQRTYTAGAYYHTIDSDRHCIDILYTPFN